MTEKQTVAHLKKVSSATVKARPRSNEVTNPGCERHELTPALEASTNPGCERHELTPTLEASSSSRALSVDVNSLASKVSTPLESLKGIRKKAEELLQLPNSMSPAPGQPDEARMVISSSGNRPHLVIPCKGDRFKCDTECINFKSLGLCSHTIAVAEYNKRLPEFLMEFQKTNKSPNFTVLALHGMPSGRGRKGSVAPRKRKKKEPVSKHIDRLASPEGLDISTTTINVCGSASGSQLTHVNRASSVNIGSDSTPGLTSSASPWPYFPWGYQSSIPMPPFSSPFAHCQTLPPPMADDSPPFNLHFISGNISKCAGCGNKYVKPAMPPYDLCIQHKEWRSFTVNGIQQYN